MKNSFIWQCFVTLHLLCFNCAYSQKCHFCRRKNVGVVFDPAVSIVDILPPLHYQVSNLYPFISIISNEFTTLVISDDNESQDTAKILEAINLWEAQETGRNETIQVDTWLLNLKAATFTDNEIVQRLKQIWGNSTGTRNIILHKNPDSFGETFSKLRRCFSYSNLHVSVAFDSYLIDQILADLEASSTFINELKTCVQYLDSVHFIQIPVKYLDEYAPPLDLINDEISRALRWIDLIEKHTNRSLSYGMIFQWPDTTEGGIYNYSKQVEFWEGSINLANRNNLTVIFDAAFDVQSRLSGSEITTGWWRLVENSSYTSTSQFVFKDKRSLAIESAGLNNVSRLTYLQEDFQFDPNFTSVLISFIVSRNTPPSKTPELARNLVSMISTRFRSIVVNLRDFVTDLELETFLISTASHNEEFPSSPISLSFWVYPDFVEDANVNQSLKLYGSAKEIIFRSSEPKLFPKLQKMFPLARLFSAIKMSECLFLDFKEMTNLIENGQFYGMLVYGAVGSSKYFGYIVDIDRVVNQVTFKLEKCSQRLRSIKPSIDIIFTTGISDTTESVWQDYTSLVYFWKAINDWAIRSKHRVAFYRAVDPVINPTENDDNGYNGRKDACGWWATSVVSSRQWDQPLTEKRWLAIDRLKETEFQENLLSPEPDSQSSMWLPIGIAIAFFMLLVVFTVGVFAWRRQKAAKTEAHMVSNWIRSEGLQDKNQFLIITSSYFSQQAATLIGTGQYGVVYKCYMDCFQKLVAVKLASSNDSDLVNQETAVKSLLFEIKILANVGYHENILKMIGVSLQESIFMVTEYCVHGSLLSVLRSTPKENAAMKTYDLLKYCTDIASGMEFLAESLVLHGDLSARNILLDENRVCKICDFGLSRKLEQYETYMKKGDEALPWRWMAYESLLKLEFSAKTDVWSMGITFWEIFTLGQLPFPEMAWDKHFCGKLLEGLRPKKPDVASDSMYKIMLSCWKIDSSERPSPKEIRLKLGNLKMQEYEKM